MIYISNIKNFISENFENITSYFGIYFENTKIDDCNKNDLLKQIKLKTGISDIMICLPFLNYINFYNKNIFVDKNFFNQLNIIKNNFTNKFYSKNYYFDLLNENNKIYKSMQNIYINNLKEINEIEYNILSYSSSKKLLFNLKSKCKINNFEKYLNNNDNIVVLHTLYNEKNKKIENFIIFFDDNLNINFFNKFNNFNYKNYRLLNTSIIYKTKAGIFFSKKIEHFYQPLSYLFYKSNKFKINYFIEKTNIFGEKIIKNYIDSKISLYDYISFIKNNTFDNISLENESNELFLNFKFSVFNKTSNLFKFNFINELMKKYIFEFLFSPNISCNNIYTYKLMKSLFNIDLKVKNITFYINNDDKFKFLLPINLNNGFLYFLGNSYYSSLKNYFDNYMDIENIIVNFKKFDNNTNKFINNVKSLIFSTKISHIILYFNLFIFSYFLKVKNFIKFNINQILRIFEVNTLYFSNNINNFKLFSGINNINKYIIINKENYKERSIISFFEYVKQASTEDRLHFINKFIKDNFYDLLEISGKNNDYRYLDFKFSIIRLVSFGELYFDFGLGSDIVSYCYLINNGIIKNEDNCSNKYIKLNKYNNLNIFHSSQLNLSNCFIKFGLNTRFYNFSISKKEFSNFHDTTFSISSSNFFNLIYNFNFNFDFSFGDECYVQENLSSIFSNSYIKVKEYFRFILKLKKNIKSNNFSICFSNSRFNKDGNTFLSIKNNSTSFGNHCSINPSFRYFNNFMNLLKNISNLESNKLNDIDNYYEKIEFNELKLNELNKSIRYLYNVNNLYSLYFKISRFINKDNNFNFIFNIYFKIYFSFIIQKTNMQNQNSIVFFTGFNIYPSILGNKFKINLFDTLNVLNNIYCLVFRNFNT